MPIKTSIIAIIIFNFGTVLNSMYSITGINIKYADTTLEIVVESISFDPNIRNTLKANDSIARIKHCCICLMSILKSSFLNAKNSRMKPIVDVNAKN